MLTVFAVMFGAALAQEEGLADVQSVTTNTLDAYTFKIDACDKIRAIARDSREADAERSKKVVVTIENTTTEMCVYQSVAMTGWVSGSYVVSRRNAADQGFFILPGKSVSLRISPKDVDADRGALRLEIPPDRGQIVLIGMTPEES